MTTKVKYNRELLEQVCERDKCVIDFANIEKYNRDVRIEFVCSCGNIDIKTFRLIYESTGAFCGDCTKNIKQSKMKSTCLDKYGVENPFQSEEAKNKSKQTCLEKYGVENPRQSEEAKNKSKQTCLEKYGVEHPMFIDEIKDKIKKTCLEKYGVENPMFIDETKDKIKKTCLEKYGVDHNSKTPEYKEKYKQTCLETYGVEHPSQNSEISEKQSKNSYKLKSFTFPCGNTVQVQGYEPYLLDILVKDGYTFEDIITKRTEIPEIWYNKNDKKFRYYCDVYIPKNNTIYEVKSTYTRKIDIEKNKLKQQACIDAGYNFELYVFDSKGVRQLLD